MGTTYDDERGSRLWGDVWGGMQTGFAGGAIFGAGIGAIPGALAGGVAGVGKYLWDSADIQGDYRDFTRSNRADLAEGARYGREGGLSEDEILRAQQEVFYENREAQRAQEGPGILDTLFGGLF